MTSTILSKSTFYQDLDVAGTLSGPTVTRIDNERAVLLNSLSNHITNYNTSETANQTERQGLQTQITTNANTLTTFNSTFTSRTTFVDTELKRLDDLHTADDTRLTAVETELKNVDTDIKQQITDQIAKHNTDIANLDPRVAKFESKLIIDDTTKTITIPSDYTLVILGAVDVGPSSNFGNPEDLSSSTQFDSNVSPSIISYNGKDYTYNFTNVNGPFTTEDDVTEELTTAGLTSFVIDRYIIVLDTGIQTTTEMVLVSHSSGQTAYVMHF